MRTYVLLTKLSAETTRDPGSYRKLVDNVKESHRKDCPQVADYWLLDPWTRAWTSPGTLFLHTTPPSKEPSDRSFLI